MIKNRKYIYISPIDYSGTIYKTQIIDWLESYKRNGLDFDLWQGLHFRTHLNIFSAARMIRKIKSNTTLFSGSFYFFPSTFPGFIFNALILLIIFSKYLFHYDELLVFSRGLYGRELNFLKKIYPKRIISVYDARGAAAEEYIYSTLKSNLLSKKRFSTIAHLSYLECYTANEADMVFAVSKVLQNYYIRNYHTDPDKFFTYPCLSNSSKFYYDKELRDKMRKKLGYEEHVKVLVYAGGFRNSWHLQDDLFYFLDSIAAISENTRFLVLSKDKISEKELLESYPRLSGQITFTAVENEEIFKYYNAGDIGILIREDTIMNNVAAPTKFSEYVLCGLPVLISKGVGDYSQFVDKHKIGFVINFEQIRDMPSGVLNKIFSLDIDKAKIAEIGIKHLSKESLVPHVVEKLIQ
jgi:glycosyltransferase involved in cell wall biosynthesis